MGAENNMKIELRHLRMLADPNILDKLVIKRVQKKAQKEQTYEAQKEAERVEEEVLFSSLDRKYYPVWKSYIRTEKDGYGLRELTVNAVQNDLGNLKDAKSVGVEQLRILAHPNLFERFKINRIQSKAHRKRTFKAWKVADAKEREILLSSLDKKYFPQWLEYIKTEQDDYGLREYTLDAIKNEIADLQKADSRHHK